MELFHIASSQTELFLGEYHNTSSFRRLVRQRGKLGRIRQFRPVSTVHRNQCIRLSVSKGNRTCLIQHQDVNVARGFYCPAAHSQNVGLVKPAHTRYTDRGKQRADRRRRQTD